MQENNEFKYSDKEILADKEILEKIFNIEHNFSFQEKINIQKTIYIALKFAEKKHKLQFRDSWEKYIEHLKRTLYNVFDLLSICIPREYINDLINAAIFHDIIEDTNTSYDELQENFWKNVAIIVKYISKDDIKIYNWDTIKRNKEYFKNLKQISNFKWDDWNIIILKSLANIIKAADRIDNLNTIWCWDTKRIELKIKETVEKIIPIYNKKYNKKIILELQNAVNNAQNTINKKINNI